MTTKLVMSPFWWVLWSCAVSLGWLLPNHYAPWVGFHVDAWIAILMSIASLAVFWRASGRIQWHWVAILTAGLTCIPWLQAGFGQVGLIGTAWISSAYLLGLLVALITGTHWESNNPNQMIDGLLLAIGIASLLSVGLQLRQWLQIDGIELWTASGGQDTPYGNLVQPNQLGTLLLWGLLAIAWGVERRRIGAWVATAAATFLLFGVALTNSRAAWIGVTLIVVASWYWRNLWTDARFKWVVSGLGLYFVICVLSKDLLHDMLLLSNGESLDILSRFQIGPRRLAWAAFMDAIVLKPWFGYGWNQVTLAQMAVAIDHPTLNLAFTYSHNLFLDLVLWCGVPLGLTVSGCLLFWFLTRLRAVKAANDAILMLFLLVFGSHAMFELPHCYAYFLLPVGLVIGSIDRRLGFEPALPMPRKVAIGLWLVANVLLIGIIRDYIQIEPSYENLRMQQMRIKVAPVGPPDVLLLNQWREQIEFARYQPRAGVDASQLDRMRHVAALFPGSLYLHKLATILALNQHPDEAKLWLQRMCKAVPDQECRLAKSIWEQQSTKYPEIAAIPWPVEIQVEDTR